MSKTAVRPVSPDRLIPESKKTLEELRDASRAVKVAAGKVGAAADRLDKTAYQKAMLDGAVFGAVVVLVLVAVAYVMGGRR